MPAYFNAGLPWTPELVDMCSVPISTLSIARRAESAGMRLFIAFCVADPVRYQMIFERPVPGFEPALESFQITAAALAGTRADMAAAGAAGEPALDMFRALITRPGSRLAFTTWERLAHPAGDNPQRQALASTFHDHPLLQSARADYRQLIENAGLAIETYREPPGWRRRQQALAEGIIAAEAEVAEDMGRHYTAMARVFLADLPSLRYILVTARRPARTPG